jgi:hypothetical protein
VAISKGGRGVGGTDLNRLYIDIYFITTIKVIIHIYIISHMDFLPKTANLQGGDTRNARNTRSLANHG